MSRKMNWWVSIEKDGVEATYKVGFQKGRGNYTLVKCEGEEGTAPGRVRYTITDWKCDCDGFKSHRTCKHVDAVKTFTKSEEYEKRIGSLSDELSECMDLLTTTTAEAKKELDSANAKATDYAALSIEISTRIVGMERRIAELEESLYLEREHVGRLMDQLASEETYASESFAQNDVVHWHKKGYTIPVRCEVVEVTAHKVRVKTPDGRKRWFDLDSKALTKAI